MNSWRNWIKKTLERRRGPYTKRQKSYVQHYLWRAVDQNGVTIDILVQPKRDRWAALRFFRKLLHAAGGAPRVIITDKLRSMLQRNGTSCPT